jgi:3alpha(or 20beta)-hydroxysteroid dehydrogenase
MALGLRAAGATVAVSGRDPAKNEAIAEELGDPDAVFSLEVREEEAIERTVAGVLERFGRLDIMVNNVGLFERGSYWNSPERTGVPC